MVDLRQVVENFCCRRGKKKKKSGIRAQHRQEEWRSKKIKEDRSNRAAQKGEKGKKKLRKPETPDKIRDRGRGRDEASRPNLISPSALFFVSGSEIESLALVPNRSGQVRRDRTCWLDKPKVRTYNDPFTCSSLLYCLRLLDSSCFALLLLMLLISFTYQVKNFRASIC